MKIHVILTVYATCLFMSVLCTREEDFLKITQEEIKKYMEAFESEKDETGTIDIGKLRNIMNSLGLKYTDGELDTAINLFGDDETNTLNKDSFLTLMEIKTVFNEIAGEKEVINKEQLINVLRSFMNTYELNDDFIDDFVSDFMVKSSYQLENGTLTYEKFLKGIWFEQNMYKLD